MIEFVSDEAETMTLAAILLQPSTYDEISSIIDETDFYYESHKTIFLGIRYLYNKNMYNVKTLIKLLDERGKLYEVGGEKYIHDLRLSIPTLYEVKFYAEKMKEKSMYRKALEVSNSIKNIVHENHKDINELVQKVNDTFANFSSVKQSQLSTIETTLSSKWKRMKDNKPELSPKVGFNKIDNWMNGIGLNRLIVMAGRPGTGKTAFALALTKSVAKQDFGVPVVFSMEMEKQELVSRMLSDMSGVAFSYIMRNEIAENHWDSLDKAREKLNQHEIYIDDNPKMDLNYITSQCRRLKRERGKIGVIVIDYLGLMNIQKAKDETKSDAIGRITSGLKQLAREIGCSVLLLCQMNRAIEQRGSKRPTMSDLRDSGSIEQDADMVIFLYRENEDGEPLAKIDFIVEKGRQTGVADFKLHFNGAIQRYTEA